MLAFEHWLESLLGDQMDDMLMLRPRMGALEQHLADARAFFQAQLAEAKADLSKRQRDVQAAARQQEQFQSGLAFVRLQLSDLRVKLDSFGTSFVDDCVWSAGRLIDTDAGWAKKLKDCFELAVGAYASRLRWAVRSEVDRLRPQPEIPDFAPGAAGASVELAAARDWFGDMGGALVGLTTAGLGNSAGAVVGGALRSVAGKGFLAVDVRKKTLAVVEQAARRALPALEGEADRYIAQVDGLVATLAETGSPRPEPASFIGARGAEGYYEEMIGWCDAFQAAINQVLSG